MPKIIDTKITDRINYNNPKGFRKKVSSTGATIYDDIIYTGSDRDIYEDCWGCPLGPQCCHGCSQYGCEGNCGEMVVGTCNGTTCVCWCHPSCASYGDCCDDICTYCPEQSEYCCGPLPEPEPPVCNEVGYFCMHEGGYMDGAGTSHSDCGSCVEFSQYAENCEDHCGEFTLCYDSNNHDPNDIPANSNCECSSLPAPECDNGGSWTGGWSCDTECVRQSANYDDCHQPSFCQYCDYLDGWPDSDDDDNIVYVCQGPTDPVYMCTGSWDPGDTCDFYGMSIFQGFCDCSGFCRFDFTEDQGWGLIGNGCCENCQSVDCAPACAGGGPHGDLISCDHWQADNYDCTHMDCDQLLYEIEHYASGWDNSEWFTYMDLHCGQNISDYVDHYMNLETGFNMAKTAWNDFWPTITEEDNLDEMVDTIDDQLAIIETKKDDIRTYFLANKENSFDNSTIKNYAQEIEEALNTIRNLTIEVTIEWDNESLGPWNEGIKMVDDALVSLKQFKFIDMARGCFKHIAKLFKCGVDKLNDMLSDTKQYIATSLSGCGDSGNPNNDNPQNCYAQEGSILGQDVIMLIDETYQLTDNPPFDCGSIDVHLKFGISSIQTGDISVRWDEGAVNYEEWKAGEAFKFIIEMDGMRVYHPLDVTLDGCASNDSGWTDINVKMGHLWSGTMGRPNSRNYWWDPSGNVDEWASLVVFQWDVSAIVDENDVLTGIGIDMPINDGWNMFGNQGNMGIQNPYVNFVWDVPGFTCSNCGSSDDGINYDPLNFCPGGGTCGQWWNWPCHAMTAACFVGWTIAYSISAVLNLGEILLNLIGKFYINSIINNVYKDLISNGFLYELGGVQDPDEAADNTESNFNTKMAQLLGVVGCEWENMKVVWGYFLNILDSAKIIQSLNYTTIQRDIADDAISTFKDGLNDGPKSSLKNIKLNEPTLWEGWVDDAINQTQVLIDDFEGTLLTITGLSTENEEIIDEELSLINEYLDDIENFDWNEDMETEWCDGVEPDIPCGGSCPSPDSPDRWCSSGWCLESIEDCEGMSEGFIDISFGGDGIFRYDSGSMEGGGKYWIACGNAGGSFGNGSPAYLCSQLYGGNISNYDPIAIPGCSYAAVTAYDCNHSQNSSRPAEYCHFSNPTFPGSGRVFPGNCAPWWGWEDVWNPGGYPTDNCPDDASGGGNWNGGGGGGGKRPKPDPIDTQQQYKKGGRLKRGKHRTKPVGRGM